MAAEWVHGITDAALRSVVGAEAFRRGAAYAQAGRVLAVQVTHGGTILAALVQGGGHFPYTVEVCAPTDGYVGGDCECPIGYDCKHVAAAVLAARGIPQAQHRPGWERALAPLASPPPSAAPEPAPLALQVELVDPITRYGYRGAQQVTVGLRPVIRGRSGKWVRTGVSWRTLQVDGEQGDREPAHVTALQTLYAVFLARQARSGYYGAADRVSLNDCGPAVWRVLAQAVADGVELVATSARAGTVTLSSEPAAVSLDLRRDDAGEVQLRPIVTLAGEVVDATAVTLTGSPPHGVAVPAGAGRPGLTLAPLDRPVEPALADLLQRRDPVGIPDTDLDRFVRDFYPAVRRTAPVRSSDGSVDLPRVTAPVLRLAVAYADDLSVQLDWAVRYGEREWPAPGQPADDPSGNRDLRAEQRLLADLPPSARRVLELWHGDQLVPRPLLRGRAAVDVTSSVLPDLHASPDVVVEVHGATPQYREATAAPVVAVSATDSPDADWFDLGVTVSIEGEPVPFAQLFAALAADDTHLMLASGTWFALDRPELVRLRRLIEEARELQDSDRGPLRISRFQAGLWDELRELGLVGEQSARWQRCVQGLLDIDAADPPPLPAGLTASLRPYQREGYTWLSFLWDHRLGGILADDMGLGKTIQTLALVCRAQEAGELTDPVLVVAPTSVVSNWAHEAARFAPGLRVRTVTETERRRGQPLDADLADVDLVITSYALFRIDETAYRARRWSGLVLDEAQFVKNHQAKSYQCARRLTAPFKLAITGTPLENSLMDLWALLSIVAPGLFPDPKAFTETYRTPIERGADPEVLATLRRRISPLMRRRSKELVAAELPPKQEQVLEVTLNPRHQKIYQTHLQAERRKVLGLVDDLQKNRFTIFRSLTLLRQLALDPALVDEKYTGVPASKADAFLDQLREVVGEGHRALVFSQFTGFLGTIRTRLEAEGIPYVYLDGRTRNRAERIAEFRDGRAPVFLISLKAGGFGLNLTEADYVFVLDPWWNPAAEAQAVDRAHRIGQDKTVMVYRLVATNTIEEKVMALKARKQDLFSRVMDDDALMSGPLTADDIRGLFA